MDHSREKAGIDIPHRTEVNEAFEKEITMSTNDKVIPTNIPTDADAYYEAVASQEEIYLEETEEELRAIFTSDDPSPHNATAECWRRKREELELGRRTEIDDRRK